MELLGNKNNPHTRPLPGRWTPFQNLMSRCNFACTKCSTDTISMTSEQQYDGLLDGSSTPHTSRGYQADVSNITSSSDDRRDAPRLYPRMRQDSVITDSDLPPIRAHNHLGLVFSPGRRAQLSRQQLSWMQALSKNTINTPPSLRDAQFLTSSNSQLESSNETSIRTQTEHDSISPDYSPPRSPSNFSVEQTRVAITQHLLTDPSSDEADHLPLQSTIVDVYNFQNENTMFNLDERNNSGLMRSNSGLIQSNSALVHSQQSSTESLSLTYPDISQPLNDRSEHMTSQAQAPIRDTPNIDVNQTAFQNSMRRRTDSEESLRENLTENGHNSIENSISNVENIEENCNTNSSDIETFRRDIWSEDTNCNTDCDVTNEESDVTDETTIGTSQESAEETVLLDYSENFTFNPTDNSNGNFIFNPLSSHEHEEIILAEDTNEIAAEPEARCNQGNENSSRHIGSQAHGDSSSERNLPVHLLSLFENPLSSSETGSTACSHHTQTRLSDVTNDTTPWANIDHENPTAATNFNRPFPRFNPTALNPNNQDRWATRIIRSNTTNSQQSSLNSQAVRSDLSGSGTGSRNELQNWYVYDPRLVPGNRQVPRLNLEMQYRGIQQLWSMPAIIGPPDYDELSTLQSESGAANDVIRPTGPPPPYLCTGIPPPTYDEAIFDSIFQDDVLGLDNPVYVDPSPPPTLSDINAQMPCEAVLQQLENVLNLNSNSPLQSPGDTLTSCATEQSQSRSLTNSEHITNSSTRTDDHNSLNLHNRISSISAYFPDSQENRAQSTLNSNRSNSDRNVISQNGSNSVTMPNSSYSNHSVPLQNLRSALSVHLQSLNHNALYHESSIRHSASDRSPAPRNSAGNQPSAGTQNSVGNQNSAGNFENYFNRPAIMYNRSVWSESHSRNNFGLGNRLSAYNSTTDVSQIH